MMNIIDIKAIVSLFKDEDILVAVDNTFASSYIQQPLTLGADIVMHSATKYLAGHSDVILGALILNNIEIGRTNRVYTKCKWCYLWSNGQFPYITWNKNFTC